MPDGRDWAWAALLLLLVLVAAALALAAAAAPAPRPTRTKPPGARGQAVCGGAESVSFAAHDAAAALEGAEVVALAVEAQTRRGGKEQRAGAPASKKTASAPKGAAPQKKAPKPWREYKTWDALEADEAAHRVYLAERAQALTRLPQDWSRVREQAAGLLADNREWLGYIDYVDGRLEITEKVPSPLGLKEGTFDGRGGAVPPETLRAVARRPALFLFHTHPGPASGQWPSPDDFELAVYHTYRARYAAHIVVAPDVVYLYGLREGRRAAVWADPNPHYAALRLGYDIYNVMWAHRSYADYFAASEIAALAEKFGVLCVAYPSDRFVREASTTRYFATQEVDFDGAEKKLAGLRAAAGRRPGGGPPA